MSRAWIPIPSVVKKQARNVHLYSPSLLQVGSGVSLRSRQNRKKQTHSISHRLWRLLYPPCSKEREAPPLHTVQEWGYRQKECWREVYIWKVLSTGSLRRWTKGLGAPEEGKHHFTRSTSVWNRLVVNINKRIHLFHLKTTDHALVTELTSFFSLQ